MVNMQIKSEHIFLILVIFSCEHKYIDGFRRQTTMCSTKRISCLNKSSFRFCFQAGSEIYLYGSIKRCPYGTECNEVEGKNACVENEFMADIQNTTVEDNTEFIKENQRSSIISSGKSDYFSSTQTILDWSESSVFYSHETSRSTGKLDSETLHLPTTTILPFTIQSMSVPTQNPSKTSLKKRKKTSTAIWQTSLSLPTESSSNVDETTTKKIQRRKKPTSSKLNKSTSKSKRRRRPTRPATENTINPLSSSTYMFSKYLISEKKTDPFTESYLSSKKTIKRRRKKKPQKYSSTTALQPVFQEAGPIETSIQQLVPPELSKITKTDLLTTIPENKKSTEKFSNPSFANMQTNKFQPYTKNPLIKLKEKKKPVQSTENSTVETTSKSIPQQLGTTQIVSTSTYAEIPTYKEPLSHVYVTKRPTAWLAFNSPLISDNIQVQSPPTTITALDAPFPCPYYLNRLFSRSTSTTTTTTTTTVRPTPPSSCKSTGKYPSQNCHEYFQCLEVMWWYRLMILKCKKGEGFDANLLQCVPDETCV